MIQITLDSLEELRKYYQSFEVKASDINLTNLFIWRHEYHFHYEVFNGFLWIVNVKNDQKLYFSQPIGDYISEKPLIKSIGEVKEKYGDVMIKKCDSRLIEILQRNDVDFEKIVDKNSFDYLYDMSKLMELKGKKYHKKKNHINQFMKKFPDWEFEFINDDNIEAVMKMNERWFQEREVDNSTDYQAERVAIREALNHREFLDFRGGVLKANGRVVAFTLGEELNKDTLVIHIEKADINFSGSYAMINQQYLIHQNSRYTKVNREQDLGIEGLRRAKLSYHPIGYVEKFIVNI